MSSTELWYQLPPDMTSWNTAVLDNVAQRIPQITDYVAGIEWSKLDPATGDADGIIQLLNGMCAAPITIRGNKLAPIDIIASNYGADPKFYPLSDTFLQKIYADNVIGKPVEKGAQTEEDFLGPSIKIKHIKTVDATKYASAESAKYMLNEITKSAKVANWMVDNMPEVITALKERADEKEKTASEFNEFDLPDVMFVWKNGNNYYANNNLVDSETISDFLKMANATTEERTDLMNGKPIVRDLRDPEKIASIHIPTEQEVVAMNIDTDVLFDGNPNLEERIKNSPIALATAYLKDGSSRRGIIFTPEALSYQHKYSDEEETFRVKNPQEYIPEIKPENVNNLHRELFICSEGYGFNTNIKTDARIQLPIKTLKNISTANDSPAVGMIGIFIGSIDECLGINFGRVEDVYTLGKRKHVRIYDLLNHRLDTVYLGPEDKSFYEVTNDIIPVASANERVDYVSNIGINGILTLNSDGRLVLDGDSYTVVNCPYALMNKYAASYEDAERICDIATTYGKCEFESIFTNKVNKIAAVDQSEDHTKKNNNKNTKAGTDDEVAAAQPSQPQLAQQTPEQMMNNDANALFGSPGAGHATDPTPINSGFGAGSSVPVSSKDLENVVTINSPKVMDAYVMTGLAQDGSLGGTENLMRTSDAIVAALEHLSKLLFLARHGGIDFVAEGDIQAAMQKLNDVASSIGMQPTRIGQ